jgi:hypothetical protein
MDSNHQIERGGLLAYVINYRIDWTDSRELRFARFNSRVLLSSKDQDDLGNIDLQLPPLVGMANIYPPVLVELARAAAKSTVHQKTHV